VTVTQSDDKYILPETPRPEPTESRPHRLTFRLAVAALGVAALSLVFAAQEACETRRAREAAEVSATAAKQSADAAKTMNDLTAKALLATQQAAAAAQDSAKASVIQASSSVVQANMAASSAKAAERANSLTAVSLRARVTAIGMKLRGPLAAGDRPTADVYFQNSGHSEAVDVRATVAMLLRASLPEGNMPTLTAGGIQSSAVISPDGKTNSGVTMSAPLTSTLVADLKDARLFLFVFGIIEYDTFGERHTSEFCFYASPERSDEAVLCQKWNTLR
jgi:hypothetical protein